MRAIDRARTRLGIVFKGNRRRQLESNIGQYLSGKGIASISEGFGLPQNPVSVSEEEVKCTW